MTRSEIKKALIQVIEKELRELEDFYTFQNTYMFDTTEIEGEIRAKKFELESEKDAYILLTTQKFQEEGRLLKGGEHV